MTTSGTYSWDNPNQFPESFAFPWVLSVDVQSDFCILSIPSFLPQDYPGTGNSNVGPISCSGSVAFSLVPHQSISLGYSMGTSVNIVNSGSINSTPAGEDYSVSANFGGSTDYSATLTEDGLPVDIYTDPDIIITGVPISAVPEPSSFSLLLCIALLGLSGRARRKFMRHPTAGQYCYPKKNQDGITSFTVSNNVRGASQIAG
jgi:hypothetical protein